MRTLIKRDFDRAFEKFDVLVAPTSPTRRLPLGAQDAGPAGDVPVRHVHHSGDLAGLPGISVPCGFADGLPVGLQIIGSARGRPLFQVAHRYQQVTDWHTQRSVRSRLDAQQSADEKVGMTEHRARAQAREVRTRHRPGGARPARDTQSKMFCGCSADYSGAPPEHPRLPVCLGMPGTLPVINQPAVEFTIMTGLALNCEIPEPASSTARTTPIPT